MKRPTKEPCLKKKSAVLLSSGHFGSVAPSKILQRIQPVTHGCGAWRGGGRRSGTGNCSRGWAGSEGWGGTDPPACWVWLRWSPADAGLSRPDQITVLLKSWPTCAYSGRFLSVFFFCIADCWQLKYILYDTRGLTACNGHQQTSLGHLEPGVQVFQQLLSHIQPAVNPNTHRNNSAIISRQKRRHTFVTALTLCSCRFRLLAPKSRQRPPGCREWLCAFQWNWTQTNEWKDFESLNKREIINKTRSHRCPWIQFT